MTDRVKDHLCYKDGMIHPTARTQEDNSWR